MAKYDVFISYSRKDSEFAEKVCAVFDAYKKFYKFEYFFDREEIKSANEYLERIADAITESKALLFLASKNSYSSIFCSKELLFANEYNVTIHRYCIDNSKPPKKINLLLIDQHFQEASTCPIEKMVCQVLSNALKKDILPLSVLCCSDNDTPPLQPRNPINWRKWIKGSAIGAFAVALVALFAYALFAPDTIVEPTAAEDSVSIVNTVKTQPIQKEKQVAQTAEKNPPKQSVENSKDTEVKQSNKPKQQTTQTSSKESASPKVTTASTATTQQNTSSVVTSTAKPNALTSAPYKVGDYYNDGKKQGVVFEVSADGKHGKIVSMTQSSEWLEWSSDGVERKRLIGADSRSDGAYNMAKVKTVANWREKYPAFKWCADLGKGWYLPSIMELKKFTLDNAVHDAVNRTLTSIGGEKLFNRDWKGYWSSTESNVQDFGMFCAWFVTKLGGNTYLHPKNNDYYVRAVSAF